MEVPGRENSEVECVVLAAVSPRAGKVAPRLEDQAALELVAKELQAIERKAGIERILAIGELILLRFFGGDASIWRDRRRNKNNSIRRLAQRPDCPYCKSALTEAVAVYVAVRDLHCVRTYGHISASHVAAVLRIEPQEQVRLLQQAQEGSWNVRQLRAQVVALRRAGGERRGRPAGSEQGRALGQLKSALAALEAALDDLSLSALTSSEGWTDLRHARRQLEALSARLVDLALTEQLVEGPSLVAARSSRASRGSGPVASLAEEDALPFDAAAQ